MAFRNYVEMTDPSVIRALAHPARAAILAFLSDGPATATECSHAADESPSSCSYHLRTLAKLGFVEETPSEDGRERRWRLKVEGHGIPKSAQNSPAVLAASRLWGRQWIAIDQRILAQFVATQGREPKVWQKAATFFSSEVNLTPEELMEVAERFISMLKPYLARKDRERRPEGTRLVHVTLMAFPRPEDPALRRRAARRRKGDRGRSR